MHLTLALIMLFAAAPVWKKPFRAESGFHIAPDGKRLSFWIGEKPFLADPGKPARPWFAAPKPDQPGKHDQTGVNSYGRAADGRSLYWHVSRLNEPESDRDYCYRYSELFQTDLEGKGGKRVALLDRNEPSEGLLVGPNGPALLRCACPPRKEDKFAMSCRLAGMDESTLAGPVLVAGRYDWELSDSFAAMWPSWRGSTFGNAPAPVVWSADGRSWTVNIEGRKAYRGAFGPNDELAVFTEPYPGFEEELDQFGVVIFDPATGASRSFTRRFQAVHVAWSPDGKWLAMHGKDFTSQPPRSGLFLTSWPEGKGRRFVARDAEVGELAFSQDGRRLAYPNTAARIFLYDVVVGGAPEELPLPAAEYGAVWFWTPEELLVGREKGSSREFFARMLQ